MKVTRRSLVRLAPVFGCLMAAWWAPPAYGYIEAPHTLGTVVQLSTNVVHLRVEKVDREKNLIIYRKVRDLKGVHPTDVIKHNVGHQGFNPREWQYVMEWAEVGKTAVFFHNGGASETCTGNYWYQAYAGDWWNMSHGEPGLLRTYCGNADKLAAAVAEIVAGREAVVSSMADGNREDLHLRRARIQRLRASLKLADYNPKRDFAGWGGEDLRRLDGMPGFSHYAPLARVDPEAQAIAAVDVDGDGKPDLCLVGAGRIAVLQNGGNTMSEIALPGATGCRAAVWADYNGDGKPDLFLATPTGPKLYTNLGGTFRDDSHLLPHEPYYDLTAAAWIDYDGDGHPDLLIGNGFHGLRLYRNAFPVPKLLTALSSDQDTVRQKAYQDLEQIGPAAEPALRQALAGHPSAEVRHAIELLLAGWQAKKAAAPAAPSRPAASLTWFDDVSVQVGLGPDGIGSAVRGDALTVADVNGDGRPDFLYSAGTGMLILNTPKGFVEQTASGVSYRPGKVGPVFGDYDNDGHIDLFVPQTGACKLFHNDGTGHFTDVTASAGLDLPLGMATSAAWGDLDNDGHLDLVVGCLRGPNRFFRNRGDGTFVDATEAIGLHQRIFNTQAVCLVDLNDDGMLDLVLNNEGQESALLLGNPAFAARRTSLTVRVSGTAGVIDSRVQVLDKHGRSHGTQYLAGGDGRGGQRAPQAHFALQPGTYRVEVRYSSGLRRAREITVADSPFRGVIDDQTPKVD